MGVQVSRYSPSRHYLTAGVIALLCAAFSFVVAWQWLPAAVPAVLFVLTAGLLLFLATRPAIEIHDLFLKIGNRHIPWRDIRRVDRTGWISPLLVHLTLADHSRVLLMYPGDYDSANSLSRQIRRNSKDALIDSIPYPQFWGESAPPSVERRQLPSPSKYPLLRPEDEAEVERMFQRLKAVGRLDKAPEEK